MDRRDELEQHGLRLSLRNAADEGRRASFAGAPKASNPHLRRSVEHAAWDHGFDGAELLRMDPGPLVAAEFTRMVRDRVAPPSSPARIEPPYVRGHA